MYAIDDAVRNGGRFAINVLPVSERERLVRLMSMRRRQPGKAEIVGLEMDDAHGIPFFKGSLRILFCEVEQAIPSGDRQLYVARVLESRPNAVYAGQRPLLFGDVNSFRFPSLPKTI